MRNWLKNFTLALSLFNLTLSFAATVGNSSELISSRKIKLMPFSPDPAFAFRVFSDTTITFYFGRAEWITELKKISSDSNQNKEYLGLIDSIQKGKSPVEISTLPNYDPVLNRMSPVGVSWEIFERLLTKGSVYIKYSDDTFVSEMKTKQTKVSTWKMTEFIDSASGKVLYRYSRTNRPGF